MSSKCRFLSQVRRPCDEDCARPLYGGGAARRLLPAGAGGQKTPVRLCRGRGDAPADDRRVRGGVSFASPVGGGAGPVVAPVGAQCPEDPGMSAAFAAVWLGFSRVAGVGVT